MIQPNELRIGNYVTDEFYDSFKSVFEVDSINEKGINLLIEDDGNWSELAERWIGCEYTFGELYGIPLTEQWLLDFGFEQYAESCVCKGWYIGENAITNDFLITLTWMKNDDGTLKECFYKNGYFVIEHVHQLQNLFFALTGEELNIKEKV